MLTHKTLPFAASLIAFSWLAACGASTSTTCTDANNSAPKCQGQGVSLQPPSSTPQVSVEIFPLVKASGTTAAPGAANGAVGNTAGTPANEGGSTAVNSGGTTTNSGGTTTNADGTIINSGGTTTNADGTTINSGGTTTNADGTTINSGGTTINGSGTTTNSDGTTDGNGGTPSKLLPCADVRLAQKTSSPSAQQATVPCLNDDAFTALQKAQRDVK